VEIPTLLRAANLLHADANIYSSDANFEVVVTYTSTGDANSPSSVAYQELSAAYHWNFAAPIPVRASTTRYFASERPLFASRNSPPGPPSGSWNLEKL
jgi:hypothetical protein